MTSLVGEFIQSARNRQGLTLKQLSITMPSQPNITFLSRLEAGKINAPEKLLNEVAQVLKLDAQGLLRLAKRDQTEQALTQEAYLLQLPFGDDDRIGPVSGIYDSFGELCYQLGEQMYVEFRYHDMIQAFKSAEKLFSRLGRNEALRRTYYRLGQSYVTLGLDAVGKAGEGPDPTDYFLEAIRYLELVYQEWPASRKRHKNRDESEDGSTQLGQDYSDTDRLLVGKSLAQSALAYLEISKLDRENNSQLYFRGAVRLAVRAEELYRTVIRDIEARNDIGDLERRLLADAYHKRGIVAEHIEEETKPQSDWQFSDSREHFKRAIEEQKTIAPLTDPDLKHLARMHKDLGIALGKITHPGMHIQALWQHTLAMQLHRDFEPMRNPDARQRLAVLEAARDADTVQQEKRQIVALLDQCNFDELQYPMLWPDPAGAEEGLPIFPVGDAHV